jgi:hypothetical protein
VVFGVVNCVLVVFGVVNCVLVGVFVGVVGTAERLGVIAIGILVRVGVRVGVLDGKGILVRVGVRVCVLVGKGLVREGVGVFLNIIIAIYYIYK